jgi:hypothetical protein
MQNWGTRTSGLVNKQSPNRSGKKYSKGGLLWQETCRMLLSLIKEYDVCTVRLAAECRVPLNVIENYLNCRVIPREKTQDMVRRYVNKLVRIKKHERNPPTKKIRKQHPWHVSPKEQLQIQLTEEYKKNVEYKKQLAKSDKAIAFFKDKLDNIT